METNSASRRGGDGFVPVLITVALIASAALLAFG
jgi:hypothetical protein